MVVTAVFWLLFKYTFPYAQGYLMGDSVTLLSVFLKAVS